jgi:hypothetical protein
MPLLPHTPWLWLAYGGSFWLVMIGTMYVARRPELLESLFGRERK